MRQGRIASVMNVGYVVIIPHYNDSARLGRCLDALRAQDRAGVDVVVVDNGSTEPLDQAKAANPDVRFVTEPGKGAARARNRGVAESRAEAIIFLDADCVPQPDWLAAARRAAGSADIVGGAIDVFDETPPPRSGAEAFETVFAFNYKDYIERKGFSVTANLVTTRTVFEAVGPFTNGLSEDAEWWRLTKACGSPIPPGPTGPRSCGNSGASSARCMRCTDRPIPGRRVGCSGSPAPWQWRRAGCRICRKSSSVRA